VSQEQDRGHRGYLEPERSTKTTIVGGLYPHNFVPRIEAIDVSWLPWVLITREVYEKMWAYIDIAETEIGWLGTVRRQGRDFVIDDVFLFDQFVNQSVTQITEEGLGNFVMELLEQLDEETALDVTQRLHFWGHSHVSMDTNPSPQDDHQSKVFIESGIPWFVRGIFNKGGKAVFDIYLIEEGLQIKDAPWAILDTHNTELRDQVANEIAKKVKRRHMRTPAPNPKLFTRVVDGDQIFESLPAESFHRAGDPEVHHDNES
jgi:hypothetical protein